MVFHYPKINAHCKWLSENIIILPFMFWMDAEWHDSFGLIDTMYRSISHQNSGHTVIKPRVRGKFMQEFEAWRVKDLESRNKREKAGLQTVQHEKKPIAPHRCPRRSGTPCEKLPRLRRNRKLLKLGMSISPCSPSSCVPCHWLVGCHETWQLQIPEVNGDVIWKNDGILGCMIYILIFIFRYYLYIDSVLV